MATPRTGCSIGDSDMTPDEARPMFAYSFDEETCYGEFGTIEEAVAEGLESGHRFVWAGKLRDPCQPETYWQAMDWIEDVVCQDDYSHDCAENSLRATRQQQEELEDAVRKVMAEWLNRHGLRPTFRLCDFTEKWELVDDKPVKVLQL